MKRWGQSHFLMGVRRDRRLEVGGNQRETE